jgi:hypothetical protein
MASLIHENLGAKAYTNFIKMVWGMEKLSATAFLNNLYALEEHNWDLEAFEKSESAVSPSNQHQAFATVVSSIKKSSERDDTWYIRNGFVKI